MLGHSLAESISLFREYASFSNAFSPHSGRNLFVTGNTKDSLRADATSTTGHRT
jgi:hypothetical protein